MTAQNGANARGGPLVRLLPHKRDYEELAGCWKQDLAAGVTVAIVALPLALAFGVTTGLGAGAGLITAIVAGAVAGVFGGSNVQVSGPTGAMTVVLVPIVARYGPDAVLVVGIMAGALILVAALSGVGKYLAYLPWPVIEGFTAGIAVIIFLQQVPFALGVPKPAGDKTAAVAFAAVRRAVDDGSAAAAGLVVLVVAVMLIAPKIRRSIPRSLVAVVVATGVAEAFSLPVGRIGTLPTSLPLPSFPTLGGGQLSELFAAAIATALLASIESLLSAKVADGMADGGRYEPDRELFGQGLANLVSPLFGGMPATGAIARTAVNVRSGARTRFAAVVHSMVLLLVVLFAGGIVGRIPLAALAGVLMVTAWRMVDVHGLQSVMRSTRSDAVVLVVTGVATVALDLILAVEIGIVVAALLTLRQLARTSGAELQPMAPDENFTVEEESELLHKHVAVYRLDGSLFFGASQKFLDTLTAVSDVRVVILRLSNLQMMDATGAGALGEVVRTLESRGVTVLVKGLKLHHRRVARAVGALDDLEQHDHLFDALDEAVAHARLHVDREREVRSPLRV